MESRRSGTTDWIAKVVKMCVSNCAGNFSGSGHPEDVDQIYDTTFMGCLARTDEEAGDYQEPPCVAPAVAVQGDHQK